MKKVKLFKVGADPEFSFRTHSGDFVEACDVIKRVRSRFGLDGCAAIAELRPLPSINPSEVVKNLYDDMLEGYYGNPATRDLFWKAGSDNCDNDSGESYPTGGHIHFGIRGMLRGSEGSYEDLVDHLDCYLAQTVRLLEDPGELSGRCDGDYGYLGDYRTNSHGLEYRTLGSWLTSPRVAEGVLCLAQVVTHNYLHRRVNGGDTSLGRLAADNESDNGEPSDGHRRSIRTQLKDYRKKFPTLQRHIRNFPLYSQHQMPIEFLFKLIEKNKTWYPGEDVDMKMAWGISTWKPTVAPVEKVNALPAVRFEDIWKRAR